VSSQEGEGAGTFSGLSYVLPDWELRVTKRCLVEDLEADEEATLEDVSKHPIVRAFLRERKTKTEGTRTVSQLGSSHKVWVLTQAQRHRGGTWYEAQRSIVWLVASGHHESGSDDDFFPYFRRPSEEGRLAPSKQDYEGLFEEQAERFAARVLIEAPLLRKEAREAGEEISAQVGGRFGVKVAIEVAEDLEEIWVAFDLRTLEVHLYIPVILGALEAEGEWEQADRMSSRPLQYYETAYRHLGLGE